MIAKEKALLAMQNIRREDHLGLHRKEHHPEVEAICNANGVEERQHVIELLCGADVGAAHDGRRNR